VGGLHGLGKEEKREKEGSEMVENKIISPRNLGPWNLTSRGGGEGRGQKTSREKKLKRGNVARKKKEGVTP